MWLILICIWFCVDFLIQCCIKLLFIGVYVTQCISTGVRKKHCNKEKTLSKETTFYSLFLSHSFLWLCLLLSVTTPHLSYVSRLIMATKCFDRKSVACNSDYNTSYYSDLLWTVFVPEDLIESKWVPNLFQHCVVNSPQWSQLEMKMALAVLSFVSAGWWWTMEVSRCSLEWVAKAKFRNVLSRRSGLDQQG